MTGTILVISHGHVDFSAGGAEVAAYQLFAALGKAEAARKVVLLAGHHAGEQSGLITVLRNNEFLWRTGMRDWFKFQSGVRDAVTASFRRFLGGLKPDIVFVHHYAHMGLELLREIRHTCPRAKIVLTLHEFQAICANNGQMVKRGSAELCFGESLQACVGCYPDRSEEDFWLRKHFIRRHFDAVDRFIAPSEFLRQRYISWGLPAERIAVIENGQPEGARLPPRTLPPGGSRNRFAFFGQVTPFKGVDVLLSALANLPRKQRKDIHVEIHGANLEHQEETFRNRIEALRRPLMEEGVLHWPGAYHRDDLGRRMARIDWVVVPSVWWENSPVVIQEAFRFGRPLLCSNIGGMAEHVRDGIDGLHVGVGNTSDWGETLLSAAADMDGWDRFYSTMKTPLPVERAAERYLAWALENATPALRASTRLAADV
ncbi:glycosyltransferase family 4 protein [Xanthobacter sp. DSM 14520]|uniref:glycosyltransferase family 4 protein n=1 Tax=Xanthobacter autotrophicus (strain ATCC BAA-1158 / Py2) TaxID=78245 RepID=UPI003728B177